MFECVLNISPQLTHVGRSTIDSILWNHSCLSVCPVHVSLPKWTKIGPKTRVFLPFFKFGSLVFLEIAYTKISCNNVSHLFQPEMAGFGSKISYKIIHITSSRGEIHEKNFWTKFGLKRAKITWNQFFCCFLKFGSLVFLKIA